MIPDDTSHDLLPEYAAGTLDESAAEKFRRHLADCDLCRHDFEFMREVADGATHHGREFFADHASVEDIVAIATGEDDDIVEPASRQHLEICGTCAAEVRWVKGEAIPGRAAAAAAAAAAAPVASSGRNMWGWATAAAAMVGLVMILTLRPGADALTSAVGISGNGLIETNQRGVEATNVVRVSKTDELLTFTVTVDLAPDAFPAAIALMRADDTVLFEGTIGAQSDLDNDLYLGLYCGVDRCTPGDYKVRVAGGTPHEHTLLFSVVD